MPLKYRPTLLHFQQLSEIQAEVFEELQHLLSSDTSHQPDITERDLQRPKPSTSTTKEQRCCPCATSHTSLLSARMTSKHLLPTNLRSSENTNFASTVTVVVTRKVTTRLAITFAWMQRIAPYFASFRR